MAITISLPDSLRGFLEKEMCERGDENLDACAARLIERAKRTKPPHKEFEIDGRTYRLVRLSDRQDYELHRRSIVIDTTSARGFAPFGAWKADLAETYAVCRHLFGERGRGFDDWKGDFAFPLALEVPRAARRPAYLFTVINLRSCVECILRKLVDPADERLKNPIYYPADEAEFPAADVQEFIGFFAGFVKGFAESLTRRWEAPFLLSVQSNLILYGFDGEQFFTRDFESREEFEQTRAALAERLPTPGFYASDAEL